MARCSCPMHDTFLGAKPPAADLTCPLCRRPFCKHCYRLCSHECDWGGGVTEEPVRTPQREPEPAPA